MVPPAQIQAHTHVSAHADAHADARADARAPATYGALFRDAADLAAVASRHAIGAFDDAQRAADTVVDLERFLAIGGRHLKLLLAPAEAAPPLTRAHREVAHRLAGLRMERRGGNPWADASDRLGLAHDVLATHLGPHGEPRTPDAQELANPEVQVAGAARLIGILAQPVAATRGLLASAGRAQPHQDPPLTRSMTAHLRQATAAIQRSLDKAPPLPLPSHAVLDTLDSLAPAVTKLGGDSRPDHLLGSRIAALSVLRQVSYRQSLGLEPANAHTLQELCRLGAATCRTAEDLLPLASPPLGRVRRAAEIDRLRHAATHWDRLGASLYPRIQGLAKAPPVYRDAVRLITHGTDRDPAVTQAVLAALPVLAAHAAGSIQALQQRGELVTRRRATGQLVPQWRPLDAATSRDLALAFTAVGQATRLAHDAVRREVQSPRHAKRTGTHLDQPVQRHELGVTR